jgi:hypothetical protein
LFSTTRGELANNAASAACGHELEELERFLAEADVHLDPSILSPRWDGTPMNLADSVGWMFVAEQTRATTKPV